MYAFEDLCFESETSKNREWNAVFAFAKGNLSTFQSGNIAFEDPRNAFIKWILHISETHAFLQEKCDKINAKNELSNAKSDLQNIDIAFLDVSNFKLGKGFLEFENQSTRIEFAEGILLSLNV
jgi:hypothetical protein